MLLGYNTNGFAHHRLPDALRILADLGYQSVAITVDHDCLDPSETDFFLQLAHLRQLLEKLELRSVIETGARFLLNPWLKHQPTLISAAEEDRHRRLTFLCRCVDIAHELGADTVSFWSGTPIDDAGEDVWHSRLVDGMQRLCDHAEQRQVRLAFEPEPGMLIDTMARWQKLQDHLDRPQLGLTVDVGHLHCQGETPIAEHLHRWRDKIWNIHIEDMKQGVHDHLMFGEGEIDFPPVLSALGEIGYEGGVHVELSRHSHDAVATARKAIAFLRGVYPFEKKDG